MSSTTNEPDSNHSHTKPNATQHSSDLQADGYDPPRYTHDTIRRHNKSVTKPKTHFIYHLQTFKLIKSIHFIDCHFASNVGLHANSHPSDLETDAPDPP
jgi:hypothetical protein